jgi:hypothetical protein
MDQEIQEEQVKVSDMRDLVIYTDRENVQPEYQSLLDEINATYKEVPHYLAGSVELIDPAVVNLTINHMQSRCRMGHTQHSLLACMQLQVENWFSRMEDVAKQQKITLPPMPKDWNKHAAIVLVKRAEHLTSRIEDGDIAPFPMVTTTEEPS